MLLRKLSRFVLWVVFVLLGIFGIGMIIPTSRILLVGVIKREPFEGGKPAGYWVASLKNKDPKKRAEAADHLGRIGSDFADSVPALAEGLKDEDTSVRSNSAQALHKIGPASRGAARELGQALKDENPWVRRHAALALQKLGPDARPALGDLLAAIKADENSAPMVGFGGGIRQIMAGSLGRIGPDARDAVPTLLKLFQEADLNSELRRESGEALQKIDPDAAEKAGVPKDFNPNDSATESNES